MRERLFTTLQTLPSERALCVAVGDKFAVLV
jgi:hypothetical protein